ncbi:hypothetical protein MBLNU457_5961t1 [Dothideomycetes sp. NU457]
MDESIEVEPKTLLSGYRPHRRIRPESDSSRAASRERSRGHSRQTSNASSVQTAIFDPSRGSLHLKRPGDRTSTAPGKAAVYAPPERYDNQSDTGTSSPVTPQAQRRNPIASGSGEASSSRQAPRIPHPAYRTSETSSSSVSPPQQGLSEASAPRPAQHDRPQAKESTGDQEQENLNELRAPEPAGPETRLEHGQPYLEEGGDPASFDEAEPPHFGPKHERTPSQARESHSKLATTAFTICYLIFFSIFGTLARLGLQWLTFYPGDPITTPVLWANFGGCIVMGFLSEDRNLFREEWGTHTPSAPESSSASTIKKNHGKVKKTIPLYIGLATGFCGSFTSFSSFQRDIFLALSNDLPASVYHPYTPPVPSFSSTLTRNGGYSFMALVAVIISTLCLSLSAIYIGAHLALAMDPITPTIPFRFTRRILDPIMLFLGPLCWLGAVFLAIFPPDRPSGPDSRGTWANEVWRGEVLFALVFAPVGCLIRWYASLKLNGLVPYFPLGTFAVNIFGTCVEGMCYDLQHAPLTAVGGAVGGGRVGCQVLQGVQDGFCGCLTTVSTWVAELQGLRRRHAWLYGAASVLVGLALMVIIMGSVRWTIGFSATACVTSRTSL